MPSSMTAFARHSIECHWGTAAWEIRSVNHRYLETGFRMPETVRDLEATLRELTRKHLQRGKVDCTLQLNIAKQSGEVAINQPLAEQYITASEQLARLMADPAKISPLDILRWPGVLSEPEIDREELKNTLLRLFEETLDQLVEGRRREGGKLGELVEQRLDGIAVQLATVRSRLPELLAAQRQKLIDRLQEVSTDLDQNRLEQELVLIAQRADVDEELDLSLIHI